MLRKRSRPVTGSGGSKISAADRSHNSAENNGNSLLPPLSQPPPPPSPSPPEKKSIKLLPASLFFFNSSKLFSNLFFTADSNSITETETPPPPQPSVMNHPPSSRFEANKTFFAPPPSPTSQLGGANSSILTDKQQQKPNPTKISSSTTTTTTTKQHNHNHHHHFWDESNPEKGIGLVALIDETLNGSNNNYNATNPPPPYSSAASSKQQKTKLVVFGSQLKIQIPPSLPQFLPSNPSPTSSSSCCNSPGEFGIKTPRSNLFTNSRNGQQQNLDHDGLVRTPESISIEEIELSEDYTCVITHGPNPKTTRIFGNCILESCCGGGGVNEKGRGFCSKRNDDEEGFSNWSEKIPVVSPQREKKMEIESFLSFCHHCKKKIGEGNDIYMYRGEKAFCSQECRCQGMLFEEVEA